MNPCRICNTGREPQWVGLNCLLLPPNPALHKVLACNTCVEFSPMLWPPRLCRTPPQKFPTGQQESCDDKTNWSSEIPVATIFFFSKGWWFAVEQGPLTGLHDLYCTVLQREEPARVFLGLLFPGGGSWDASVRAQRWSPSAVLLSHTAHPCGGQANPCQIHQVRVFCRRNKLRTFWCLMSGCTVYSEAFPLNVPSEDLT